MDEYSLKVAKAQEWLIRFERYANYKVKGNMLKKLHENRSKHFAENCCYSLKGGV